MRHEAQREPSPRNAHSRRAYETPLTRGAGFAVALLLHGAALFVLLQIGAVRAAVEQGGPLFVSFIVPELPKRETPPPSPPPPRPRPKKEPPLVASKAPPAPQEEFVVAAPPEPEPAPEPIPVPPSEDPPAVPTPPPIVAEPPAPKVVTAVEFIRPPQVEYPPMSRRLGERGRVVLRVLIDREGHAERVEVHTSSGSKRLDEAAIKAAREALYRPYRENGEAMPVWALLPTVFELS